MRSEYMVLHSVLLLRRTQKFMTTAKSNFRTSNRHLTITPPTLGCACQFIAYHKKIFHAVFVSFYLLFISSFTLRSIFLKHISASQNLKPFLHNNHLIQFIHIWIVLFRQTHQYALSWNPMSCFTIVLSVSLNVVSLSLCWMQLSFLIFTLCPTCFSSSIPFMHSTHKCALHLTPPLDIVMAFKCWNNVWLNVWFKALHLTAYLRSCELHLKQINSVSRLVLSSVTQIIDLHFMTYF